MNQAKHHQAENVIFGKEQKVQTSYRRSKSVKACGYNALLSKQLQVLTGKPDQELQTEYHSCMRKKLHVLVYFKPSNAMYVTTLSMKRPDAETEGEQNNVYRKGYAGLHTGEPIQPRLF